MTLCFSGVRIWEIVTARSPQILNLTVTSTLQANLLGSNRKFPDPLLDAVWKMRQ